MLNIEFKNEIDNIRRMLTNGNIHEVYDRMISLNEFNKDVDDYTCYFMNSIDASEFYECEENELDGIIIVENGLGNYQRATMKDIEETLNEIEENLIVKQVILKIKEIIERETCLEKINDNQYKGEISLGYDDMYLDFDLVKEYTNKGRECLEDAINNWRCDSDVYEYEWILDVIEKNIDKDIYNNFEDDIIEYINENVYFVFPEGYVWDTKIPVNILINSNDDTMDSEEWLVKQQGYEFEDFKREVKNEEEFSNTFFKSLCQEIIDTTSYSNDLVASLSMSLKDFFDLKEAYNDKKFKKLSIDSDCNIGLVDFYNGGGSLLNIALENDLVLPIENISDIDFDGNFHYGIGDIYGFGLYSYWNEVNFEVI